MKYLFIVGLLLIGVKQCFCQCSIGYFNATGTCQQCPPGYFSNTTDSTTCYECPVNTFSGFGSSTCTSCDDGKDTRNQTGASFCADCEPGTFSNNNTNFYCIACPNNTVSGSGANNCSICPACTEKVIRDLNGTIILMIKTICNPCGPGWRA